MSNSLNKFRLIAAVAAIAVVSACAKPPEPGLTPQDRSAAEGRTLSVVTETEPEPVARIEKKAFVGIGLIGAAVALAATAAIAAAENAASDIDEVTLPTNDPAAWIEERLLPVVAEELGVGTVVAEPILDTEDRFTGSIPGRSQAFEAAKAAGYDGLIFNVRNKAHGVLSEGAVAETEHFRYIAELEAYLLDAADGNRLSYAICTANEPLGTLSAIEAENARLSSAYEEARADRDAAIAELAEREAAGETVATSEDPEHLINLRALSNREIVQESVLDRAIERGLSGCLNKMRIDLLSSRSEG